MTNAQTYTGGTILDAGNLILSGNGALASGGALTLGAAAHVDVSGTKASGLTLGNVSGSGSISLGAKALTLGTADNIGYAGPSTAQAAHWSSKASGNWCWTASTATPAPLP